MQDKKKKTQKTTTTLWPLSLSFFLHYNTEVFVVKTLIYGFNEKTQLTTKSSDLQCDRKHTQQQVSQLFLDHLTTCSCRYIYGCVHTQLNTCTHTHQTMEPQKWDRNHHFPQTALKAVTLCVSCSKGKSFTEDAAQILPILCLLFQPCIPVIISS